MTNIAASAEIPQTQPETAQAMSPKMVISGDKKLNINFIDYTKALNSA